MQTTREEMAARQQIVELEVASMTGMDDVKLYFDGVRKKAAFVQGGGDPCVLQCCLNLIVTGNPGSGDQSQSLCYPTQCPAGTAAPHDVCVTVRASCELVPRPEGTNAQDLVCTRSCLPTSSPTSRRQ